MPLKAADPLFASVIGKGQWYQRSDKVHAGKGAIKSTNLTRSVNMMAYLYSLFHRRLRQAKQVACASGALKSEEICFKALVTSKFSQVAHITRLPVKELSPPFGSKVGTHAHHPLRKGAVMQLAGLEDRHTAKEHAMSLERLAELRCLADLTPDQRLERGTEVTMSSLRLQQAASYRTKERPPLVLLQSLRYPNFCFPAAPKNLTGNKGKGRGMKKDTQVKSALHTAPSKTEQHSIDTMPKVWAQALRWMFSRTCSQALASFPPDTVKLLRISPARGLGQLPGKKGDSFVICFHFPFAHYQKTNWVPSPIIMSLSSARSSSGSRCSSRRPCTSTSTAVSAWRSTSTAAPAGRSASPAVPTLPRLLRWDRLRSLSLVVSADSIKPWSWFTRMARK